MKLIFISYPKSGRTWMRYVFHLLNCEIKFTHAGHGTTSENILSGKPFTGLKMSALGEKNIFMHRNPLDTAVSLFFQLHKHEGLPLAKRISVRYLSSAFSGNLPPKDINKFALHPVWGVENICKFNRAWLDYFEENPADSMVLSYEEAKRDLASVVKCFIDFAGAPPCDVDEIVKKADFDAMKKLELQGGSKELRLHGQKAGDPDTMKVRKGVVKGYREYLDAKTIEEATKIAARYGFDI